MAYRSAYQHLLRARLAEMRRARELFAPVVPELRAVHAARVARIVGGAVGIAGAAATVGTSIVREDALPTWLLLGSSAAALAGYAVTRVAALALRARFRRHAPVHLTGDLRTDLERLDPGADARAAERQVARLELPSIALPLVAISLLAPLTLHFSFSLLVHPGYGDPVASFTSWIRISEVVVGHAHLALVALSVAFARRLTKSPSELLPTMRMTREWLKAWGFTIIVSCVPGVLLFLVPPLLTAVTGMAFIPVMFLLSHRRILLERRTVDSAVEAALPGDLASGGAAREPGDSLGGEIESDDVLFEDLRIVSRA